MKKRVWKDIRGFEGLYQVSNLGEIKSLGRKNIKGNRIYPEKTLKLEDNGGYKRTSLSKNGKTFRFLVHRVVADNFLPINLLKNSQINHINGNPGDNRIENLEWVTAAENAHHKATVLNKKPRGVYCSGSKWSAQIVVGRRKKTIGVFSDKRNAYKAFYNTFLELRGVAPWDLDKYPTH